MVTEMKEENNMDDLLVKQLLGEANSQELSVIAEWLAADAGNKQYFAHFELIWQKSKLLTSESNLSEEEAWGRFQARVKSRESPVVPLLRKRWSNFLRIAAALLVVAGSGWLVYLKQAEDASVEQIVLRSEAGTKRVLLPDSSVVTMNAASSISYPASFSGATREVTLTGEAFFEVTPNKDKPFIIQANKVSVRVVGTSFNVKTTAKKTEVIVETGVVEVAREQRKVTLKPAQKVIIERDRQDFKKERSEDVFYNYYRTGKLVCNDTPLWRLVEILNELYHADIIISSDSLKQRPINTTFEGQTLEESLKLISETIDVQVVHHGKQIILQ